MRRIVASAAGALVLVLAALATVATEPEPEPPRRVTPAASAPSDPGRSGSRAPVLDMGSAGTAGVPTRVRVPALGIDSGLDPLELDTRGGLETPPQWDVAGWFSAGPRPGETGPAVIAGHVDSPAGPAVFTGLRRLRPGYRIEVDDAAGRTRTFRVDRLAQSPRNAFPTHAVYAPTPDPQLRLITCAGVYRRQAGGYEDNLIVFATEVPS